MIFFKDILNIIIKHIFPNTIIENKATELGKKNIEVTIVTNSKKLINSTLNSFSSTCQI